jgi:GTPase
MSLTSTPVIALVGRPNVGKSTLFNRLTQSRTALVADMPGLTRDRQYGRGKTNGRSFIVIDTGGFEPVAKTGVVVEMARQARQAIVEADVVIFVVDGRQGLTGHDSQICDELRKTARKLYLVVNKSEGMMRTQVISDFFALGLGEPLAISAAHGEGVRDLVDLVLEPFPRAVEPIGEEFPEVDPGIGADKKRTKGEKVAKAQNDEAVKKRIDAPVDKSGYVSAGGRQPVKVAIVGRPNAGKSTLINTLLGEERLIAFDQPGTTRDSVAVDFERNGRPYVLIDTAGVRRRGKVTDMVEKFSVVKTLQAIEDCNVCVLMLDACEDVADQDANIAGYILDAGRALVIAVNKWDKIEESQRVRFKNDLDRKLFFLKFAKLHYISAINSIGVGPLMKSVDEAHAAAFAKLPTPKLTRSLISAVEKQSPPRKGIIRPKLRYAHQGGQNPPVVVIHGNALDGIGEQYKRYLEAWFREQFKLVGTPLRIELRSTNNPYAKGDD